jgi:NhaA family Na+:H+ antiporter
LRSRLAKEVFVAHSRSSKKLPKLPSQHVSRVVEPIAQFMHVQAASGIVLLVCTIAALVLANSPWSAAYLGFWKTHLVFGIEGVFTFDHSLKHVINDGLMAIFFFVIGLEVKREIVQGELRDLRSGAMPIAAAIGGMIVPATIYFLLQRGQPGERGWGIPMATDIAFVVGCMALLGPRVPKGLRIMLLSLAIVDDIGAILVIAFGYTDPANLHWNWLGFGLLGLGIVWVLANLGVRSIGVYIAIGAFIWLDFHESGVHATIAGVALGLMTPARSWVSGTLMGEIVQKAGDLLQGDADPHERIGTLKHMQRAAREAVSPLERCETALHPWVGFVIMPLFALANAGVPLHLSDLASPVAIAVALGLVVGKPVGVVLASWLLVVSGLGKLPQRVTWPAMIGGGLLAGIGFTMALFIAGLAFVPQGTEDTATAAMLDQAKVGILAGSTIAAIAGMIVLILTLPKANAAN